MVDKIIFEYEDELKRDSNNNFDICKKCGIAVPNGEMVLNGLCDDCNFEEFDGLNEDK